MVDTLLHKLSEAILKKDKALFDELFEQIPFPAPLEFVQVLCEILTQEWHQQHDEIADCIQVSKFPGAVPYLYAACLVEIPYLQQYCGLDAFHQRCTWALADIGTKEAKQKLNELSKSQDSVLANYAQERIDEWEMELHRKGSQC